MEKIEIIARRVLGWKLNSYNRWYDSENGVFIENFNPEENIEHANLIVARFERFGFKYTQNEDNEVCFNSFCAKGETLPKAITNAAYAIAENNPVPEEWI
ncbi:MULTISPECIES: BC1872 family protein [Bacillaceae]|uniref:Phage ABA sandwich domain-containing protein n=1 Tax=Evansella alkalicola TaxID=745819 RepID=A0ABS6JSF1_9BACI|nr:MULTISPECIES: hypothetical protein [Bacillaceae]MBU9721490.1 hypothetical protein [Bacillus alkalicola]